MDKEMFNFILEERIQKIIVMDSQYNLLQKSILAFSGGKDSMIVHKLLDLALPGNKIPRVYNNTGIELKAVLDNVKKIQQSDDRIVIIQPKTNIKAMLDTYGYPFKSKEYSHKLSIYQHSGNTKTVTKYLANTKSGCPKKLQYQFSQDFHIKVSEKCCDKLKKEPAKLYMKENNKTITLTGMRNNEQGIRSTIQCSSFYNKSGKNYYKGELKKFHPIYYVSDEFEKYFIDFYKLELPSVYYEPYNFLRTGCKGCPFNINLQKDLQILEKFFPAEYKQCNIIWKPVYDEYRRINYRLK